MLLIGILMKMVHYSIGMPHQVLLQVFINSGDSQSTMLLRGKGASSGLKVRKALDSCQLRVIAWYTNRCDVAKIAEHIVAACPASCLPE